MTVLLWGPAADPPLQAVYQELTQLATPVFWLDQQSVLETKMHWIAGVEITGWIEVGSKRLDLEEVTGVYLRPYDSHQISAIAQAGINSPEWHHATTLDNALTAWIEVTPALVLNRPAAMAPNHSKPYQAEQIRQFGFQVPETLITTDPEAALAFWHQHGEVIYKSISGIRSQVARLKPDHLPRLDQIIWCPTQFQKYVPGKDYRVHVVGDYIYACEVISSADDYRYSSKLNEETKLNSSYLPLTIQNQCHSLAVGLNLPLAGIDLRCTPQNDWYCFEVNPSPGFTYYQASTNQPISWAIAQLLVSNN
jgi:glutathione synthase/RimK-type ligase-like ATP-grasp enzyme